MRVFVGILLVLSCATAQEASLGDRTWHLLGPWPEVLPGSEMSTFSRALARLHAEHLGEEDLAARSARHFEVVYADGSRSGVETMAPIHYLAAGEGEPAWLPIDCNLLPAGRGAWRNAAGDFSALIHEDLRHGAEVTREGRRAGWQLSALSLEAGGVLQATLPAQAPSSFEVYREYARARDTIVGATSVLTVLPTGLKHELVLERDPFAHVADGMTAGAVVLTVDLELGSSLRAVERTRAGADGQLQTWRVELVDVTGRSVLALAQPVAYEAGDTYGTRTPGAIALYPVARGRFRCELRFDLAWLRDPARRWPVVLDPYIEASGAIEHMSNSGVIGFFECGFIQASTYFNSGNNGGLDERGLVSWTGLSPRSGLTSLAFHTYAQGSGTNQVTEIGVNPGSSCGLWTLTNFGDAGLTTTYNCGDGSGVTSYGMFPVATGDWQPSLGTRAICDFENASQTGGWFGLGFYNAGSVNFFEVLPFSPDGAWLAHVDYVQGVPPLGVTTTPPLATGCGVGGGGLTVGRAYMQTLTATGGTGARTWSIAAGALPAGMMLAAGGLLSGTPTTAGPYSFTARVTDAAMATAQAVFTGTVAAAVDVAAIGAQTADEGVPYNFVPATSGGQPSLGYTLTMGTLPMGLSLDAMSGQISGTPAVGSAGVYPLQLRCTGCNGDTDTEGFTLTVRVPLVITTPAPLATGCGAGGDLTTGALYSQQLTATGGTGAHTWSVVAGSLPAGLNLSAAGLLDGVPSATGPYDFTVQVTDTAMVAAQRQLTGTVAPAVDVQPIAAQAIDEGAPLSLTPVTTGGLPALAYTLTSGTLPSGITLDPLTGAFSGTPAAGSAGAYPLELTCAECNGGIDSEIFTLTVSVPCAFTICGDCNGDGNVNILDALHAAQISSGVVAPPATGSLRFNSCNAAGAVFPSLSAGIDVLDALIIAQNAAGLITLSCC